MNAGVTNSKTLLELGIMSLIHLAFSRKILIRAIGGTSLTLTLPALTLTYYKSSLKFYRQSSARRIGPLCYPFL
eukprot:6702222-Karenia_brevis.AAC.1